MLSSHTAGLPNPSADGTSQFVSQFLAFHLSQCLEAFHNIRVIGGNIDRFSNIAREIIELEPGFAGGIRSRLAIIPGGDTLVGPIGMGKMKFPLSFSHGLQRTPIIVEEVIPRIGALNPCKQR